MNASIIAVLGVTAAALCGAVTYPITVDHPRWEPDPPDYSTTMVGLMRFLAAHGTARDTTVPAPPPLRFAALRVVRDADRWRDVLPETRVHSHRRRPRISVRVKTAWRVWYEGWWVKVCFEWSKPSPRPVLMEAPTPSGRYRLPLPARRRDWSPLPEHTHSAQRVEPSVLLGWVA